MSRKKRMTPAQKAAARWDAPAQGGVGGAPATGGARACGAAPAAAASFDPAGSKGDSANSRAAARRSSVRPAYVIGAIALIVVVAVFSYLQTGM